MKKVEGEKKWKQNMHWLRHLKQSCNSMRAAMVLLLLVVGIGRAPMTVTAVWNNPTCNPDGPGGPTDPSCNVAAPLNVSNTAQTKAGQLTVQNTVRAGDLFISAAVSGNGTVIIETASGKSIAVTNNDPVAQAVAIKSTSSAAALNISQNGNGSGTTVTASGTGDAVVIQSAASTASGLKVTHSGATTPGISVSAPGLGQSITTSNNGSTGLNITTSGSTSTGITVASGGNGISSNVSGTGYGSRFCNNSTRCGSFGGSVYAGYLQDRTLVSTSGATNAPLFEVTHSNTSATPGYGLQVRQYGTGQTLTPITAPQGVAINTQAASSYALYAYSQLADAGYFRASGDNTSALFVKHTNTAVIGQSNYGIEVEFDGGSGAGIKVSAPTGLAGEFTSGNGKVALGVSSAKNPTTNEIGTGIMTTGGPGGIGIYAFADYDGAIGGGTAVLATGNDGSTPIYVITNSDDVTNATGILIDADETDTGILIQNTSVFDTALQTNNGTIRSNGQILGGQFYANEDDSSGIFENSKPRIVDTITIGSTITDMIFDGSDIWVASDISSVHRISSVDGRIIKTYSVGTSINKLLLVDEQVYVLGKDIVFPFTNKYSKIPLFDNFTGSTTNLNITNVDFTAVAFDGDYLWLGTTDTVYRMLPNATTVNAVIGIPGAGEIKDLVYADGYLWVSASSKDSVIKINPSTATQAGEISVGDEPHGMVYDGRFLWVANYLGDSLERIDPVSGATVRITGTNNANYLTFDGVNIWYTSYATSPDQLRSYTIGRETQIASESVKTGSRAMYVVFDGTYVWVARTYTGVGGAHIVLKIAVGTGHGAGAQPVRRGILMYGENSTLYCVYVNTSGTLTATTTLTQCTN